MCLFDVQYAIQEISTERSIRSFLTIFSQASVILFGGMGYPGGGGWICPGSGYPEGYPIGEVGISRGGMDMFRGGYLRGWVSQRGGVCMSRVGLPGGWVFQRGKGGWVPTLAHGTWDTHPTPTTGHHWRPVQSCSLGCPLTTGPDT